MRRRYSIRIRFECRPSLPDRLPNPVLGQAQPIATDVALVQIHQVVESHGRYPVQVPGGNQGRRDSADRRFTRYLLATHDPGDDGDDRFAVAQPRRVGIGDGGGLVEDHAEMGVDPPGRMSSG